VSVRAIFSRHRLLRWIVPIGVAAAVGLVAGGAFSAQAADKLEPQTAAQLLADLQTSHVNGFYGTVVQRSSLGLPELPNIGGTSSSGSLTDLLSGSHTARVWYAGPTKQRIAVMDSVNETDVFRDGDQLWQWSSATKTAIHTQLPPGSSKHSAPAPTLTPDQVAQRALAALDPTTIVQTDNDKTVAGRPAYELVLVPRATGSRIGAVHIAIDGEHKVPLGVQVFARGSDPSVAIDVSFTDINFTVPGDDNFRFTPPKGATVKEQSLGMGIRGSERAAALALNPQIIGTGWTSILAVHAGDLLPGTGLSPGAGRSARQFLDALTPVSGAWGSGRLLDSKLVSILITDDGRVFAGAVDPSALYAAAATHK
jgi:outer membrane lipoprotein-sorting protein